MDGRLRALSIRYLFLFHQYLVLVAGFWYHREFYQIGFTNLLIIGGFVTFLVIWAARLAMTGELPRGRPSGELSFTLEEGDRLLKRVARSVVRPSEELAAPSVGHVVRAKYETGTEFARLLIEDARRAFLSDLTDEDAHQAGFRSAADLREAGASRWGWRPPDVVAILPRRRAVTFLLLVPIPLLAYLAPIEGWTVATAYEGTVLGGFLVLCLGIALGETIFARHASPMFAMHAFWLSVGVIALIVAGPIYTYELEFLGRTPLAGANLAAP